MWPRIKWAVRLLLAGGLILLVATLVGWRDIHDALLRVDVRIVALGWGISLLGRLWEALQMSRIMRRAGMRIGTLRVFLANSLSVLYGMVLPGDVAASAAKWADLSSVTAKKSRVLNAVVYNRLMLTAPWIAGGMAALAIHNPWHTALLPLLAATILVLTIACFVVLYHPRLAGTTNRVLLGVSTRVLPGWVHRRVEHAVNSLTTFRSFSCGVHVWFFVAGCVNMGIWTGAFLATALAVGIDAPWSLLAWTLSVVVVLRQLPISFNGIGLREATLVAVLGQFGVGSDAAFTLGIVSFTATLLVAVVGLAWQTVLLVRPAAWTSPPLGGRVESRGNAAGSGVLPRGVRP